MKEATKLQMILFEFFDHLKHVQEVFNSIEKTLLEEKSKASYRSILFDMQKKTKILSEAIGVANEPTSMKIMEKK